MLGSYIPLLVMLILASLLGIGMVGASFFLGPKRATSYKSSPYECGMTPVGDARERFPVQFYLIAMLFIIFDIETIFLYPWAVTFRMPGNTQAYKFFLLGEMGVFVLILFVGYFYIIGKKVLDWSADQEKIIESEDQSILKPRPSIRFGNEDSGPVQLSAKVTENDKVTPFSGGNK